MDSYANMAILTLALGLALLVAEVFIPSGGLIMTAAAITLVVSIWAAWHAWFKTDQMTLFMAYVLALLVLFPSVLGTAFYIFPRTEYGKRLMNPPSLEEMEPYTAETERLSKLIGLTGTTLTRLAPGGLVLVDGKRLHAESEGMLLAPQTPIKVLAKKGNRLLVRQIREGSGADQVTDSQPLAVEEHTPLDDDFSQS